MLPDEATGSVLVRPQILRVRLFFREQFLDFGSDVLLAPCTLPIELPFPPVTHQPPLIDHVDARPHSVSPRLPILRVVVDGNGELPGSAILNSLNRWCRPCGPQPPATLCKPSGVEASQSVTSKLVIQGREGFGLARVSCLRPSLTLRVSIDDTKSL